MTENEKKYGIRPTDAEQRAEAVASFKKSGSENPEQDADDLMAGKEVISVINVDLDMTKEEVKTALLETLKTVSIEDLDREKRSFFFYKIGRLLAEYDIEVMRTCDVPSFITDPRKIFLAQKGLCHLMRNSLNIVSDDFKALQKKTGQTVRNIRS